MVRKVSVYSGGNMPDWGFMSKGAVTGTTMPTPIRSNSTVKKIVPNDSVLAEAFVFKAR
ncbi:MAG TPA: hypothetical protein PK239_09220 [Chitinophagales bacterium]|nr:hypothetical protein [Chitinophagales bacterium]HRK27457.1 hypothetical protein [Chitinophagales bacterium]